MRIDDLANEDASLLVDAFRAAAEGPFFPDWEFRTLMGFERRDLRRLVEEWPRPSQAYLIDLAANNVLNSLLGYPHGEWSRWAEFSKASPDDVAALLVRIRALGSPDASGE